MEGPCCRSIHSSSRNAHHGPVLSRSAALKAFFKECPLTHAESPRYLLSKGRREQALKNLNRLRPKHEVEAGITIAEVDAIETMMREEEGNFEGKWLDLFRPRYIKRTAVSHYTIYSYICHADIADWNLAFVSHDGAPDPSVSNWDTDFLQLW